VTANVGRQSEAIARSEAGARTADVAAVIFVPNPAVWQRGDTPGGLSLLERQLKQLRKLGEGGAVLLVPAHDPPPVLPAGCVPTTIERVPSGVTDLFAALATMADLPAGSLALSADRLVDLRVLRALRGRDVSTFASVDGERAEPVAWVRAADVARWGAAFVGHAEALPLAALDPYCRVLRGNAQPYVFASAPPAERRGAWAVLLDHVQKRSLDLPGRYFDTPFENFLVRRLAPTNVTPNQITLFTLVVASIVAGLFHAGWLRLGVVLALVVGVLDGVDGKLARLKLATSKLGELEHVGDFFYENAWYLSLASYLSRSASNGGLWIAGWLLVVCDLVDSLLYLALQRHTGKMLDEVTTFDRRFRAIAGRRNVYVMIFVVGFFAGRAPAAFAWAVTWAVVTIVVHAFRVGWLLATTPRVASIA
jgi:phosphatidylglycerophosphate synthase